MGGGVVQKGGDKVAVENRLVRGGSRLKLDGGGRECGSRVCADHKVGGRCLDERCGRKRDVEQATRRKTRG